MSRRYRLRIQFYDVGEYIDWMVEAKIPFLIRASHQSIWTRSRKVSVFRRPVGVVTNYNPAITLIIRMREDDYALLRIRMQHGTWEKDNARTKAVR